MHTPTPWHTKQKHDNEQYYRLFCTKKPKPTTTLEWRVDQFPGDFSQADAALIVKAVNSYEAMKEALAELIDEIEICKEYGSLTDKHYITGDPLTTAKKALALAEGA